MAKQREIEGYQQFQDALGKIVKRLPEETKKAAQQVAKDWISAARNKAPNSARAAAAALSIGNDQDGATLVNNDPTFFGQEFGGQARPSTMQFPPYRGKRGYWLFPAARENANRFQKIWEAAIDEATESWDRKG